MNSAAMVERYRGTRHEPEVAALVLIAAVRNLEDKQAVAFIEGWRADFFPTPELIIRRGGL